MTIIRPCPQCGKEGEADALENHLVCPFCGFEWTVGGRNFGEYPVVYLTPTQWKNYHMIVRNAEGKVEDPTAKLLLEGVCSQCKHRCEDIERACRTCGGRVFTCPYCRSINCQVKVLYSGVLAWQCTLR